MPDYSSEAAPTFTKRVALSSTAGNAVAVTLPKRTRALTVTFKQSDGTTDDSGKITSSATESSPIGDDAYPIGAGVHFGGYPIGEGLSTAAEAPTVYLAGDTASGYAHIIVQQQRP